MLEGQEISEVSLNTILSMVDFRIDADFFLKEFTNILSLSKKWPELSIISDTYELHSNGAFKDIHGYLHKDCYKNIKYIRSENVGNFFINGKIEYISDYAHNNLQKTITEYGDILTARTGKVGGASIITDDWINCNSNQNVVNIKIKDKKKVDSFYLVTFLNTKYGIMQFKRASTGNVQPWLNLSLLRKVKIFIPSEYFQVKIKNIIEKALYFFKKTQELYLSAENLLLKKSNALESSLLININLKSFKESFQITGRLDAEYYQPKYDQLFFHLSKLESKKLGEIVNIKKSIEPGSDAYQDTGIPFVRVSNLSKFGLTKPEIHLDANKYGNITLYPNKDTILLSKDGSVGIAYKVEEDMKIITSGALLHLNIIDDEFLPDYLTLVLNSPIVQLQAERDAGGSIIQHWKPSEIEEVIIPKLPLDSQKKISDLVLQSFKLKKQSEQLLEVAKKAVEIAIEQNEATAIDYINSYSELMQEDGNWC
ncbi:restriction endonuclease subunit S [Gilliamella sp. CG35]|uniref:restriction endonuclease subunit S n=2 Tax=unclassified Gilliamella TaxID=2685620 RepID=UPI00398653A0